MRGTNFSTETVGVTFRPYDLTSSVSVLSHQTNPRLVGIEHIVCMTQAQPFDSRLLGRSPRSQGHRFHSYSLLLKGKIWCSPSSLCRTESGARAGEHLAAEINKYRGDGVSLEHSEALGPRPQLIRAATRKRAFGSAD